MNWTTLHTLIRPATLREAWERGQQPGTAWLGGGSTLVAEKDPRVHTLIWVRPLLPADWSRSGSTLTVGGGLTLETLRQLARQEPDLHPWEPVLLETKPSRHHRFQSTLAGAVARRDPASPLVLALTAAEARVQVWTGGESLYSFRDWDGRGILLSLSWDVESPLQYTSLTLLPSLPPLVAAARHPGRESVRVAVGGSSLKRLIFHHSPSGTLPVDELAEQASGEARESPLGGAAAVRRWVEECLRRLEEP